MLHRRNLSLGISLVLMVGLLASPAIAHEVQISGNLGGTLHIEPNDAPRASQPSQAWFVLTRRGGQTIPLSNCNCHLAVYAEPYTSGEAPVQEPALTAVSAEGRQGIPGATITFPEAGAYIIVLSGRPVTTGLFTPFELRFSITVAR